SKHNAIHQQGNQKHMGEGMSEDIPSLIQIGQYVLMLNASMAACILTKDLHAASCFVGQS
ncbi:MAG: hypothetical protein LOD88_04835, partial [Novibacillus thermophilus]